MKLNPDLIRDILMTVEEVSDFHHEFYYDVEEDIPELLKPYSHEEIVYHVRQCDFAGLILGVKYPEAGDMIYIDDLSPAGHEFLANIRDDKIWNGTKEISKEIGSRSLNTLTMVASNIITSLIKAHFNLI